MKIRFYSESPDPGPGGAEQFIAVLAEALSRSHEVCIVHHKSVEAESAWAEYAGCDLSCVQFRRVPRSPDDSELQRTLAARYRAAKSWRREITEQCDVFIGMLHAKPPFCHARKGVIVVLFPTFEPFRGLDDPAQKRPTPKKKNRRGKSSARPRRIKPGRHGIFVWRAIRYLYTRWEWKRRTGSYAVRLSISDFSRRWTRARWGFESELLHPPIELPRAARLLKHNRIISVGRFATTGPKKKQIEMLQAFQELRREIPTWTYTTVGGLNDTPQDRLYFERSCNFREDNVIEVMANVDRAALDRMYQGARIFWHAAGLGDDHQAHPEMAEHFGLVTAEAMAHGCVPVVIKMGGQSEIVEHGVSGFLWDSLDELKIYTRRLVADSALLERMSCAARKRAARFSREACVRNLLEYIGFQ